MLPHITDAGGTEKVYDNNVGKEEEGIAHFFDTDSTGTYDSDTDDEAVERFTKRYIPLVLNDRGLELVIEEDAAQELGCRLWTAALMLYGYLRRRPQPLQQQTGDLLTNKRVLEIGAGLGVGGFAAAANGAAHVTIGECDPQSVARLVQTLQTYTKKAPYEHNNVTVCRHLWEEDLEYLEAHAEDRPMDTVHHWSKHDHSSQVPTLDFESAFDTVIGSDLLYFSSQEQPLLATLGLHLKRNGTALLFQTMRTNNVSIFERFVEAARLYFHVSVMDVTAEELCRDQLHLASETPHTTGYKLVTLRHHSVSERQSTFSDETID